jgi:hypothetical protein
MPTKAVQVGPAVRSSTHRRQTYPTGGRQDKVRKLPRSTFNAPCRHPAAGCRRAGLCDANWRRIRVLLLLIALRCRDFVRGGWMSGRRWRRVLFRRTCRCGLDRTRDRMLDNQGAHQRQLPRCPKHRVRPTVISVVTGCRLHPDPVSDPLRYRQAQTPRSTIGASIYDNVERFSLGGAARELSRWVPKLGAAPMSGKRIGLV